MRKPSPLAIPPWMRKKDYLSLIAPIPDDFGQPDVLLPIQWRERFAPENEPKTPDEKIAWKFLHINMMDCIVGTKIEKLKAIDEFWNWAGHIDESEYPYTFSWWCEVIHKDSGYMKKGLEHFLTLCRDYAINNIQPPEFVTAIKAIGNYRRRGMSGPREAKLSASADNLKRNVGVGSRLSGSSSATDNGLCRERGRATVSNGGELRASVARSLDARQDTGRLLESLSDTIPTIQPTIHTNDGGELKAEA